MGSGSVPYRVRYAACRWLSEAGLTLINEVDGIAFLLEFIVRHDKVLEESTPFASHILHEILRDKAKVLLDLLDEPITIF